MYDGDTCRYFSARKAAVRQSIKLGLKPYRAGTELCHYAGSATITMAAPPAQWGSFRAAWLLVKVGNSALFGYVCMDGRTPNY